MDSRDTDKCDEHHKISSTPCMSASQAVGFPATQTSDLISISYVIDSTTEQFKSPPWSTYNYENKSSVDTLALEDEFEDQPMDYSSTSIELSSSMNYETYKDKRDVETFLEQANLVQHNNEFKEDQIYQKRKEEAEEILSNSITAEQRQEALKSNFWIIEDEPLNISQPHVPKLSEEVQKHEKVFPSPKKAITTYMCDICGNILKGRGSFKSHLDMHAGIKSHACVYCKKKFTQRSALTAHLRVHTGETPYQCQICFAAFKNLSSLRYHMSTHSEEMPHKCTTCDKAFKTTTSLKAHLKTHLGGPFQCEKCSEVFDQRRKLCLHTKKIHQNNTRFQCEHCIKSYSLQCLLEKHMQLHIGICKYSCTICGQSYVWKSSLEAHKRTHFLKLQCEICHSKFLSAKKLAKHRDKHLDPLPHKCEKCDKEFKFAYQLKLHLSRHRESLTCDQCGKGFITKTKFTQHELTHL